MSQQIKISKKQLESIIEMYETLVPSFADDVTEELENIKDCKRWHKNLSAILKNNGLEAVIYKP